jgi:hypothetical protein
MQKAVMRSGFLLFFAGLQYNDDAVPQFLPGRNRFSLSYGDAFPSVLRYVLLLDNVQPLSTPVP